MSLLLCVNDRASYIASDRSLIRKGDSSNRAIRQWNKIKKKITYMRLPRLLVTRCTTTTHKQILRSLIAQSGRSRSNRGNRRQRSKRSFWTKQRTSVPVAGRKAAAKRRERPSKATENRHHNYGLETEILFISMARR